MGAIKLGVKYERVKCVTCGHKFTTNECNKNGMNKEDAEEMTQLGFECKESDFVCLNCILESFEIEEKNALVDTEKI